VVLLSLAVTATGFSANAGSARIIPSGTVSVIENGQVVSQFSQETPLPEGSLLRCEDKCSIKTNVPSSLTIPIWWWIRELNFR
jgi:hypothetical protein